MNTPNVACWFEIPVTDLDRSTAFYNAVLKTSLTLDDTGPSPMVMFPTGVEGGVGGHLYRGEPANAGAGNIIHLNVPDTLEASLGRVGESGGNVVSEIISIPPGRFAYCTDPDGNSFGLFQVH